MKKRLFKLSAILLGLILGVSFGKVQAADITSAFTGDTLSRNTINRLSTNEALTNSTTNITLKLVDSGYKYNSGIQKKVWKIINESNPNEVYYCLNMTQGFEGMAENSEDLYTYSEIINKSDLDKYSGITLTQEMYNKVLWILNNSYVPENTSNIYTENSYKQLMKNAGINIYSNNQYNLSKDDIITAQRLAIWHYTNGFNAVNSIEGIPDQPLRDQYGDIIDSNRKAKLIKLYNYLVNNASSEEVAEPKLELTGTTTISEQENGYLVGPYHLTATNATLIKSITATSDINYNLLDSSKNIITGNDFSKVLNKDFYILFNKEQVTESKQEYNLNLEYKFEKRTIYFMTNIAEANSTQAVAVIKPVDVIKDLNIVTNITLQNIEVEKIWNDANNQDGVRPTNVNIQLYRNNIAYGNIIKLNSSNNWRYTWNKLLSGYTYTVKELNVSGNKVENNTKYDTNYLATYQVSGNKTTITNKHIPEEVVVSGTKTWTDGEDKDGIRPNSITVKLLANGVEKDSAIVTSPWIYSFNNLPKYENGRLITYTINEEPVNGYKTKINGYNIENIHELYTYDNIALELQKVDSDGNIITSSEAKFVITGAQDLTSQTTNGKLELDSQDLIANTFEFNYIIKEETAPIGYIGVDGELTLKVSGTTKLENEKYLIDKIQITDKNGNELDNNKISAVYDRDLNKVIIKVINQKKTNEYSVKLLKVDKDNGANLAGAWFKVNDNGQATQIASDGTEIAKNTLSQEETLHLVYKLEETIAPEGYVKLNGAKEVKISTVVKYENNQYELTDVALEENIDGISVSEENNIITIKVENEKEITGKYNVKLRKVDQDGNILSGSKFQVNGTEYDLAVGEVTLLENQNIESVNDIFLPLFVLKETQIPEGYEGISDKNIYVKATVAKVGTEYNLSRVNLVDSSKADILDEDVKVELEGNNTIVLSVKNNLIQKKFDLALRKFITEINGEKYSREPIVDTTTIPTTGTATYRHSKQPIAVQKGDIVTYTIRVYNEGEVDGYVNTITDHLPNNLIPILRTTIEDVDKYEKEIEFNENWLWAGDENIIATNITSKNTISNLPNILEVDGETEDEKDARQSEARLLKSAYNENGTVNDKLDYVDVEIKCLVTDKAVRSEYLTNIAEITDAEDINGVHGDGADSTLSNVNYDELNDYKNDEAITSTEDSYIPGQEDDDDFEKLVVKEFDLALRKFITKVNEKSYSREPIVDASKLDTLGLNGKKITTATYNHTKEPVLVETDDIVTYTIRIYNEGTLNGFANEITDDMPEGLEFLPDSSVNISYKWKMLDNEGNETTDLSKAVMIVTDYLSEANKANELKAISEDTDGNKILDFKDVQVQFKIIAKPEKLQNNVIKNVAQISEDSDRDIDSIPNRNELYDYENGNNEDDIDYEPVKLQYFDLALRKFITKVNNTDYNNRYPEIIFGDDGSITYKHTKDPVLVETGDTVIYTIRIYNEGEKAGTATQIKDNLPEGLEYLPEDEINKQYKWKFIDENGNITEELTEAKAFTTDALKDTVINGFVQKDGQKVLSYEDVKIAFKVTESNTSNRILVNTAQIAEDSDDDIDSIPNNNIETEDDIDKEYLKVEYFDLALKKWVTATKVTYNGKTTTTKTGFTEDSEGIAKVDLVAKQMKNTTVKFVYSIKVINEGTLPGYATEIKDYVPNGLEFLQEDNKDWKVLKGNEVVTDQLKNTLLNPGESATVEITLTWKNSTSNLQLKTNYAEISEDSGDDIDSTPDNFNKQEDDIDDAQVILSIKTAGAKTYIWLVFVSVSILAGGIFAIKKYVIK